MTSAMMRSPRDLQNGFFFSVELNAKKGVAGVRRKGSYTRGIHSQYIMVIMSWIDQCSSLPHALDARPSSSDTRTRERNWVTLRNR